MSRKWLIIGGGVLLAMLVLIVLIITGVIPVFKQTGRSVELEFWGIDDKRVWEEIITDYQQLNPGIAIKYQQLPAEDYEDLLVNALAGAQPPDIIMFQHNWLPKHANKIAPAAPEIFSVEQLRSLFPTAVERDFAPAGAVFALPLYIDTLNLFYNKDIFDKAGLALPPASWFSFQKAAKKLGFGRTAMGGSADSVDRAADILSLLMLQDEVPMVDAGFTRADLREGASALAFYTDFANPESEYYIWNDRQPHSLNAFAEGKLGMMLGYGYHARLLRELNPFLPLGIAPVPQINPQSPVNYPFYYGLAVVGTTPDYEAAWQFIKYAATNEAASIKYLNFTNQLPTLRSLIAQAGNVQALSARSWLQADNKAIDKIFSEMIKSVLSGKEVDRALQEAEEKITRLMAAGK